MAKFSSQASKIQVEIASLFTDIPYLVSAPMPGVNPYCMKFVV